jgi:hypothetical protein
MENVDLSMCLLAFRHWHSMVRATFKLRNPIRLLELIQEVVG